MEIARHVIKEVALVMIVASAIMMAMVLTLGSLYPFYVVISESMVPTLEIDDMLVVSSRDDFGDIKPGDVILFISPSDHMPHLDTGSDADDQNVIETDNPADHGRVVVHRVVEILEDDPRVLMTQGDANPEPIPGVDFPIMREDYLGKMVYVLPGVGALAKIIYPPVSYVLIGVIASLFAAYELHTHPKWRWRLLLSALHLRDSLNVYLRVIKYDPKSRKARIIFVRQTIKNHFAVVLMGTGLMNRALKVTEAYEDIPVRTLYMYNDMLLAVTRASTVLDASEDLLDTALVEEIRGLLTKIERIDVKSGVGRGYPDYDGVKRSVAHCTNQLDSIGEGAVLT